MRDAFYGSKRSSGSERDNMQDLQAESARRAVVILLSQALVARDIELMVGEMRPEAMVVVARTMRELSDALLPHVLIDVAFVDEVSAAEVLSDTTKVAHRDGLRMVLVGHDTGAIPQRQDWVLLPHPFTNHDVAKVLSCEVIY